MRYTKALRQTFAIPKLVTDPTEGVVQRLVNAAPNEENLDQEELTALARSVVSAIIDLGDRGRLDAYIGGWGKRGPAIDDVLIESAGDPEHVRALLARVVLVMVRNHHVPSLRDDEDHDEQTDRFIARLTATP